MLSRLADLFADVRRADPSTPGYHHVALPPDLSNRITDYYAFFRSVSTFDHPARRPRSTWGPDSMTNVEVCLVLNKILICRSSKKTTIEGGRRIAPAEYHSAIPVRGYHVFFAEFIVNGQS